MKRISRAPVAFLALAAGALTVWSASARRQHAPAPVEDASLLAANAQETPGGASPSEAAPASPELPAPAMKSAAQSTPVPVPGDLKVSVKAGAAGRVLSLSRPGQLVTLWQGKERRIEMHKVAWPLKAAGAAPLMFETTDVKTLETVRGELSVEGEGASAKSTVTPAVVRSSAVHSHVCKGHEDGAGGFVVLCQVDAPSSAASIEGADPKEGVWSLAGEKTLFRFDMPVEQDGATARVLGYEKAGRGFLVRVEASRAPGEREALLSIGADSRIQPERSRPRCCICRFPRSEGPDLL